MIGASHAGDQNECMSLKCRTLRPKEINNELSCSHIKSTPPPNTTNTLRENCNVTRTTQNSARQSSNILTENYYNKIAIFEEEKLLPGIGNYLISVLRSNNNN